MKIETTWAFAFLFAACSALGTGCASSPSCDDEGCSEEEEEQNVNEANGEEEEEEEGKGEKEEPKEEAPVCGDGVCEDGETNACSDCAAPEPPPESDASLIVANSSSYDVFYVYLAPCSTSAWGNDILGSDVIIPGYQATWDGIPPGCYDIRAEDADAGYWEEYGAGLVAGGTFTWTLHD